ncbi:hypothetical protein [Halostagnicola sp. A-GB9-2]|uniref:hypothetical protein n=1 Tax=Halostagnicola sp. A-GB9-2 TaxID=3048066 RepID=UPI0024BF3D48|nr:hypothetical protein [Halostagnicola sp. A-GB9-2]MDJ1430701.1 hypothetical protein [Halostagnicola sp. A-GB9-2]
MTGVRERLETARDERWGILTDLAFAIVWVTMVEVLFQLVDGPTWAYYLCMISGIVAYFALVTSSALATADGEGSGDRDH